MVTRKLIRPSISEMSPSTPKFHGPGYKRVPPDQTHAENFYYVKQMNNKTPMVIRLTNGEDEIILVTELGDNSVNLGVRAAVASADYWALQNDLREQVKGRFDQAGITIPFPQHDLHLRSVSGDAARRLRGPEKA